MNAYSADVVVVGAGPSGSHAARGFAKAGLRTLLLEEHAEVGLPVHCTGVVGTEMLERFPETRSCLWRPLDQFKIVSPEGESFFLPNMKAFVLNRRRLDLLLAWKAQEAGARLLTNHKVTSLEPQEDHVNLIAAVDDERITIQARLAVLATGSKSHLPKRSGLAEPPQFIRGAQVEARIADLSSVELYLGETVAPGSFAWAVPTEGENAKVGLITLGNASIHLEKLFQSHFLNGRVKQVLGKPQISRIPLGPSPVSSAHRILAVGDAAGQVKTTTGGGIYYGMLGAEAAVSTALRGYKNGDFSPSVSRNYQPAWKRRMGSELRSGLHLRNLFRKVRDADINHLARLFRGNELQALVARHADFDRHSKLIFALSRVPALRSVMLDLLGR